MTSKALLDAIAGALGQPVCVSGRLRGGDICISYRMTLQDGRTVFVKTHDAAPRGMFEAEADGLAWLRVDGAPRVPRVFTHALASPDRPAFLVLEYVELGERGPTYDEHLGRGLAALHRTHAPRFGWNRNNFIAVLPQANPPSENWGEFYQSARLAPLLERAQHVGRMPPSLRRRFETLFSRLPTLIGPEEPPARLHGDLWTGNAICDNKGQPCLIDPAVYGGHREMDLAMMRLFGGFSETTFAAYHEAYPLYPGHEQRLPLYQLYPLLVHLILFGGSYLAAVEAALTRLLPS